MPQGRDWVGRCDMSDEASNSSLLDERFSSILPLWSGRSLFRPIRSFEAGTERRVSTYGRVSFPAEESGARPHARATRGFREKLAARIVYRCVDSKENRFEISVCTCSGNRRTRSGKFRPARLTVLDAPPVVVHGPRTRTSRPPSTSRAAMRLGRCPPRPGSVEASSRRRSPGWRDGCRPVPCIPCRR